MPAYITKCPLGVFTLIHPYLHHQLSVHCFFGIFVIIVKTIFSRSLVISNLGLGNEVFSFLLQIDR